MKTFMMSMLVVVILLSASCQQSKPDDPEKLKAIIIEYFDGVSQKDINRMNAVTTPDFIIYESGKLYTNDTLIHHMKRFDKLTLKYTLDDFKIYVDDHSGTIRYLNHGDFVVNDTSHLSVDWLESATFKKIDQEWKMDFLHSSKKIN